MGTIIKGAKMSPKIPHWFYYIEDTYEEVKEELKGKLNLNDEEYNSIPSDHEFLEYLEIGMRKYLIKYDFRDQKLGRQLIKFFICNELTKELSSSEHEKDFKKYSQIMLNAARHISPEKILWDTINEGRTYDIIVFEIALEIEKNSKIKPIDALISANNEWERYDPSMLIDEYGHPTQFFMSMNIAYRKFKQRK